MKKLFFILWATILLVSSCSKEEDDLIIGSWSLDRMEITEGSISATITANETITFYIDGTYMEVYDGEKEGGSYTVNKDKLKMVDSYGDYLVYEIKKISKKELILFLGDGDESDDDYFSITMYFKKK